MNSPCNTHAETIHGAKTLALKLEQILWNPDDHPYTPGKCRICGAELKEVYLAWDINGPELSSLHVNRDQPDRIKKCEENAKQLENLGVFFGPNIWCDTLLFEVEDPEFWKKDEESGYQFNHGSPDNGKFVVTPWLYAERNVDRHKFNARKKFYEQMNNSNGPKLAPIDRL